MKKYEFNMNKYIYVKLTDFGKRKIIEKCGIDYYNSCIESEKQPDGFYRLQFHIVFSLLGEYLVLWARPEEIPFELNVYFKEEDLNEVTYDE